MSARYRVAGGATLTLGRMIHAGGEGTIYEVDGVPELLAKVLHSVTPADEARLRALIGISLRSWEQPYDSTIAFAWPMALLWDKDGAVHGSLIPRVDARARQLDPWLCRWRRHGMVGVVRCALAIADRFSRLESRDVVMPDPSPANVMVYPDGDAPFVDCDSMLPPGRRERVNSTITLGHTAPETLRDLSRRDVYTMRFCLALLVLKVLCLGTHPFAGRPTTLNADDLEDWSLDRAVLEGTTRFDPTADVQLPPSAVPPTVLPAGLLELARLAIVEGVNSPTIRPPSAAWTTALAQHLKALQPCGRVRAHAFDPRAHRSCPWCALESARRPRLAKVRYAQTRSRTLVRN